MSSSNVAVGAKYGGQQKRNVNDLGTQDLWSGCVAFSLYGPLLLESLSLITLLRMDATNRAAGRVYVAEGWSDSVPLKYLKSEHRIGADQKSEQHLHFNKNHNALSINFPFLGMNATDRLNAQTRQRLHLEGLAHPMAPLLRTMHPCD